MGGGKDQKQANKQLTDQAAYQSQQQKQFDVRNTADLESSRGRGNELYEQMKTGYGSLIGAKPGGGAGTAGDGGGGGGGGGGFTPPAATDPRFQDVEKMYRNFMDTGGWEPDVRAKQQGRIDTLTDIGKTGGLTEEEKHRARGLGVYDEFSKTGGWSDKDIANARARGTSGIPAMYARMRDEANRGAAISGGYGPGRSVLMGRMGRQQAEAAAGAARDTELGIREQVNQGRQWGTAGASSSELALQDLLSKNKLQGLTTAGQQQQGMMESIMGGRQWGTGGLEKRAESDRAAAERAAAAAAAASAHGAANDKWEREFAFRQQMAGLEGLGSLYTSSPEEYMQNKQFGLASAGEYGGQAGDLSSRLKTGNKSAWDTVGQIGGMVAGGLTGLSGIGAFGKQGGNIGIQGGDPRQYGW